MNDADEKLEIEILRPADLARFLRVSRATLYRREAEGELPPRKNGVWLARDVLRWRKRKNKR